MNPIGIKRTGCGDLKAEGGGMDSQVSSTFVSSAWEETRGGAGSRGRQSALVLSSMGLAFAGEGRRRTRLEGRFRVTAIRGLKG